MITSSANEYPWLNTLAVIAVGTSNGSIAMRPALSLTQTSRLAQRLVVEPDLEQGHAASGFVVEHFDLEVPRCIGHPARQASSLDVIDVTARAPGDRHLDARHPAFDHLQRFAVVAEAIGRVHRVVGLDEKEDPRVHQARLVERDHPVSIGAQRDVVNGAHLDARHRIPARVHHLDGEIALRLARAREQEQRGGTRDP